MVRTRTRKLKGYSQYIINHQIAQEPTCRIGIVASLESSFDASDAFMIITSNRLNQDELLQAVQRICSLTLDRYPGEQADEFGSPIYLASIGRGIFTEYEKVMHLLVNKQVVRASSVEAAVDVIPHVKVEPHPEGFRRYLQQRVSPALDSDTYRSESKHRAMTEEYSRIYGC